MGKKDKKVNDIELNEDANGSTKKGGGKPLKYDPTFNGPIKNRSCTDVICCIVFVVFILGLAVVAYFGYAYGDPKLLLYPQDSDGNLCGYGNMRGKDKLYFFDLVKCGRMGPGVFVNGCPTPQICVTDCPSTNYAYFENLIDNDKSKLLYCKYNTDKSAKSVKDLVVDEDCSAYYLKSKSVINRCLPIEELLNLADGVVKVGNNTLQDAENNNVTSTEVKEALNITKVLGLTPEEMDKAINVFNQFLEAQEYAEKAISDITSTWYIIVALLFLGMVVCFIWIVLMRWIAGFMIWLTILSFVCLFAGACGVCIWQYLIYRDKDDQFAFTLATIQLTFSKADFFLGTGITAGIIFAIVFLILLFLCQRIRIAISLIKEGSKAVGTMMFTLVWPIFPFVLQLLVVAFWGTVAVYLQSVGRGQNLADNNVTYPNGSINEAAVQKQSENLFQSLPCDNSTNSTGNSVCGYLKYGEGDYTVYLQIYNLFMLFWLVNFVVALGQMTLAGAFASYYWAFNKPSDIPTFPLLSSFYRCFRYHLGTLAFGSLLIAIVQLIRVFLEYVDHKLKGTENPAAKFLLKCLKCCFWCLEKFLKFLNKNAYIMTAIYGKNFCISAKNAFSLILRNIVRVVVIDKVTDFLLFVSKLVVVALTGVAAFFFFDGRITFLTQYTPTLNFYFVPIIIVVLGTYIIASCFFSVYNMAVDTLFLCFLEDLERNDGSTGKPYYMSKDLMKIIGKKNVVGDKN
ncbi:choline transporter-like protein 2 isoform X1 [Patella vulgata]|uniref:choline transporter-like protein 2 isoform X1 n=1 Tax=Patella vulgata TaxID=6465 RepID=UPI0024A99402|nr:choline transporter-like protein 2 isoform X1 [Patella vulgata]